MGPGMPSTQGRLAPCGTVRGHLDDRPEAHLPQTLVGTEAASQDEATGGQTLERGRDDGMSLLRAFDVDEDTIPETPIERWAVGKLLAAMRGGIEFGYITFPLKWGELDPVAEYRTEKPPK